jgi:HK97 gp10 family phage protein
MASKVTGVFEVQKKLARISRDAGKPVKPVLIEVAQQMASDAKAMAPVDTGAMRNAIQYSVSGDGLTVIIGVGVKKAFIRKNTKKGINVISNASLDKYITIGEIKQKDKLMFMNVMKAHFTEYGTKGTTLYVEADGKKTKRKGRSRSQQAQRSSLKKIIIPPQRPRPFINPAYEMNKNKAKPKIEAAYKKMIAEYMNG